MNVVNEADLLRGQAEHPEDKLTAIAPAEIVKRHSAEGNLAGYFCYFVEKTETYQLSKYATDPPP